jgi:hypothetical protein
VNLFTIFISIILGYKADKMNKEKIVKTGAIFYPITVVSRAFVITSLQAIGVWLSGAVFWPLLDVPFEAMVYQKSKDFNKLEFFVMREHSICFGRIIILVIAFLLLANPLIALSTIMIVGGIMSTFYWLA